MNAKEEFLDIIEDEKVICAKIGLDAEAWGDRVKWNILKENYSEKDFKDFCDKLDFEYDDGFGAQELFGVILLEDGWFTRGEYDGSEWWEYHNRPTAEEVLLIK